MVESASGLLPIQSEATPRDSESVKSFFRHTPGGMVFVLCVTLLVGVGFTHGLRAGLHDGLIAGAVVNALALLGCLGLTGVLIVKLTSRVRVGRTYYEEWSLLGSRRLDFEHLNVLAYEGEEFVIDPGAEFGWSEPTVLHERSPCVPALIEAYVSSAIEAKPAPAERLALGLWLARVRLALQSAVEEADSHMRTELVTHMIALGACAFAVYMLGVEAGDMLAAAQTTGIVAGLFFCTAVVKYQKSRRSSLSGVLERLEEHLGYLQRPVARRKQRRRRPRRSDVTLERLARRPKFKPSRKPKAKD